MSSPSRNLTTSSPHAGTLEVHLLGLVEYSALLGLQEYLTYELSGRSDTSGVLLLCEHPPLISVGRDGRSANVFLSEDDKSKLDVPVFWTSRGGGAYAHGPGQIAMYLMIPLNRLAIGISEYRERLETAVCETCRELRVPAKRLTASAGIWGRAGQLGFFGASVRSWVTNYGLYLNVSLSSDLLKLTVSNPEGERATSIQAHRVQPVHMPALRESLIRTISTQFGYQLTDVSTGHPLLKNKIRRVAIHV